LTDKTTLLGSARFSRWHSPDAFHVVFLSASAGGVGSVRPGLYPGDRRLHGVETRDDRPDRSHGDQAGAPEHSRERHLPGVIETPMLDRAVVIASDDARHAAEALHPMNRLRLPDEVANVAVWRCSPGASFVTVVALPVDGGFVAR